MKRELLQLGSQKYVLTQIALSFNDIRRNLLLAQTLTWHSHTVALVDAGTKLKQKFLKKYVWKEGILNGSGSGVRFTGRYLSV